MMTREDVRSELDKIPFVPLRVHLVSGKEIVVTGPGQAFMLQNAVMIFQEVLSGSHGDPGYDIVAMRNIERLEQLKGPPAASDRPGETSGASSRV